jgi:ribose-phosphate pyrophosphokinase
MAGEIKLFSGSSNKPLAMAMAEHLGRPLNRIKLGRFSDGEISVEVLESIRGQDVFAIQSLSTPVNDHLMELLIIIDALKRGSAGTITAVIPYYGYARQDRQVRPRTPITAKLVADLVTAAGAQRVVSMDLHAGQIQGFFSIPFDHLYASPTLTEGIRDLRVPTENLVIVSPDAGGVERARVYSKRLAAPMAIIDKRRPGPNKAEIMHLIGNVEGKVAVIIDDMIDTAGTLTQGAQAVMDHGAKQVYAAASHAVFSGPAVSRIDRSVLEKVLVTDTIMPSEAALVCKKISWLSVGKVLGEAIERVHGARSVSSMFVQI